MTPVDATRTSCEAQPRTRAVASAMPRATVHASDAPLSKACAIVIGAEGRGVSPTLAQNCNSIRIPTSGVESLNAAIAAAVIASRTANTSCPSTASLWIAYVSPRLYISAIELARFIGVTRPGYELSDRHLPPDTVTMVDVPALAISSTDCRARRAAGHPLWYLVPDGVVQYVAKRGLYAADGKDDTT